MPITLGGHTSKIHLAPGNFPASVFLSWWSVVLETGVEDVG